jgi:uncharacterized protein (DUF1810 family)
MADPYQLQRFVQAQDPVIEAVRVELRAGRKRTHWMWFIFPQLQALGRSATALLYGIRSLDEARAYLEHPLLGPRLIECTELVCAVKDRTAHEIFGSPDDLKFHSSMSLFASARPDVTVFAEAIQHYFGGTLDARTTELLATG